MTSGKAIALLWPLLTLATAACCAEPGWDAARVDALLAQLRREPPATTAFVEVRTSRLLKQPIVVAGTLGYAAGGRMTRRIERPFAETVIVDGENVSLAREGEPVRRFPLSRAPELRGVLASFGALLAGDAGALRKAYAMTVDGDAGTWRMVLAPLDAKLRKRVNTIAVDGAGDQPRCFEVRQADGGMSVMLVGAAAAADVTDTSAAALAARCAGRPPG